MATEPTTSDLRNNRCLWYRVHVFCYDLRNYKEMTESRDRLERIVDASYLGVPYFTDEEVILLKSTIIEPEVKHGGKKLDTTKSTENKKTTLAMIIEETLNERLERRMKKRVESGDYRVCAAHDLAPIFEKSFGIDPKALENDEGFLKLMNKSGIKLKAQDEWNGLVKKSFQKKNKKR